MTMHGARLTTENLGKNYGDRPIIRACSFTLAPGDTLGVTGRNGSGKSTLMKMLADVLTASTGRVDYEVEGKRVDPAALARHLGFIAPYLNLYTEFAAWEHVALVQKLRGLRFNPDAARTLFTLFGIDHRVDDRLESYSSGMQQRVKIICAALHSPAFLLLDEPSTNLDAAGIEAVRALVASRRERGQITVIATNDPDDLTLCTHVLDVGGT